MIGQKMKFVEDKKDSVHDKTSNRHCVLDWPHNLIIDHIKLDKSFV